MDVAINNQMRTNDGGKTAMYFGTYYSKILVIV